MLANSSYGTHDELHLVIQSRVTRRSCFLKSTSCPVRIPCEVQSGRRRASIAAATGFGKGSEDVVEGVAEDEDDEEAARRRRFRVMKKGQAPPGGGAVQVTSRDLPETRELAIRQASQALSCYIAEKVPTTKQATKGFVTASDKSGGGLPRLLQVYIPVQLITAKANCQLVYDVLRQLDVPRISKAPIFMPSEDARDMARLKPYNLYAFTLEETKEYAFSGEGVIVEPDESQAGLVFDMVNKGKWRTLILINPGWQDNKEKGRYLLDAFTEVYCFYPVQSKGLLGRGTFFLYRWCDGKKVQDYRYRIFKMEDKTARLVSEFKGRPSNKELSEALEVSLVANNPLSKGTRAVTQFFNRKK